MKNVTLALAAIATVVAAGSAQAAVITPISATATSTFNNGWYNANNLINGSGLATSGLHDNFFGNMWMTDLGVAKAQLIFDLGAVYKLGSADIWQFNYADPYPVNPFTINTVDRGVKAFAILTSTNGVDYTEVYNGTMARANGDPASAQTFSFGGSAQFVKFDLFSNYAEGTIYDPYATGLSEVRFNTAAAVPEPASWAMMIGGLGLVGFAMRRRQSAKVSFA